MYQYIELYAVYRKNIYKYTYTRLYLKTQINIHLIRTTVSIFIYFYISIYLYIFWPWLSPLRVWSSLNMAFTGIILCISLTISSYYGSITLNLGLIGRDAGLRTLYHRCGFACQQRVLKTFPGPSYLHSEDRVV